MKVSQNSYIKVIGCLQLRILLTCGLIWFSYQGRVLHAHFQVITIQKRHGNELPPKYCFLHFPRDIYSLKSFFIHQSLHPKHFYLCKVYDVCISNNLFFSGYGIRSDGRVVYVNASTCDINYTPCNPPVVFDVPLPKGQSKSQTIVLSFSNRGVCYEVIQNKGYMQ